MGLLISIHKIFTTSLLLAVFFAVGCDQSVNGNEEEVVPIPIPEDVPTAANDGLEAVNISGINASNFTTAGAGTASQAIESISVEVPAGATVQRVMLYWARRGSEKPPAPSEIEVNGTVYTGNIAGGPVDSGDYHSAITHQVDLTSEGLVNAGTTVLRIKDNPSGRAEPLGASVVVFYNIENENSELLMHSGVDFAWAKAEVSNADKQEALRTTVPVTFTFEAADIEREAVLTLLIGDIEPGSTDRSNSLKIEVGDLETQLIGPNPNPFQGRHGVKWDNYVKTITIPSGAKTVRVFPISGPGNNPSSLVWALAGLSIPEGQ